MEVSRGEGSTLMLAPSSAERRQRGIGLVYVGLADDAAGVQAAFREQERRREMAFAACVETPLGGYDAVDGGL